MKRFLVLTAVFTTLLSTPALAEAKYNDVYKDLKIKVVSGELMVEARGIFDEMGYECNWDANTKTTLFTNGTDSVHINQNTGDITINDQPFQSDIKPVLDDGVTYVPKGLIESLNIEIGWDYDKGYPLFYSQDYEKSTDSMSEEITGFTGWNDTKTEYYVNGNKLVGKQYVDGKIYNFADGTLRTGIFADGTSIKGFDEYGNPYNGFLTVDGKKYYFENGNAYTEPTAINGKMYNFGSDGTFTVGWSTEDDKIMYFNEFGYPVEGIVEIDGKKYFFAEGVMQTGEVVYNNNKYLFNDDGTMVVNQQVGNIYYGEDGIGVEYSQAYLKLQNRVQSILAQIGTSPKAIYDYVVGHVTYKYMAQQDWTTMANTGFDTGRGACYQFAACVDVLLKNAGYETRVVRGTGLYTSLHYWNQVKINGSWTNIDACNKYYNVSDSYLKNLTYTFDKYEYPTYN